MTRHSIALFAALLLAGCLSDAVPATVADAGDGAAADVPTPDQGTDQGTDQGADPGTGTDSQDGVSADLPATDADAADGVIADVPQADAEVIDCIPLGIVDGSGVCVLANGPGECPLGLVGSELAPFQFCSAAALTPAQQLRALDLGCGPTSTPAVVDNVGACVQRVSPDNGLCPSFVPYVAQSEGLRVCSTSPDMMATLVASLGAAACAGGSLVKPSGGNACVFITETGFQCPDFVSQAVKVADWTVCGATDSTTAEAAASATCETGYFGIASGRAACVFGAANPCPSHLQSYALADWTLCAGDGVTTDVLGTLAADSCATSSGQKGYFASTTDQGGCLFITETGFSCPPHAAVSSLLGDTVTCTSGTLLPDEALALAGAHCASQGGAVSQFVVEADVGMCAFFITETGFSCPSSHPSRRAGLPFDMCSVNAPAPAVVAQARPKICGSGAMLDVSDETACTFITETGFSCPPLMPVGVETAGATICGPADGLTDPTVQKAAIFASEPNVCAWTEGLTSGWAHSLGGMTTTVTGSIVSGSFSADPLEFPGGPVLPAEIGVSQVYVARFNLNGSTASVQSIGEGPLLIACGQHIAPDGSLTLVGTGSGTVTFGAGGVAIPVAIGNSGLYALRIDPYGKLAWASSIDITGDSWFNECHTVGHADGATTVSLRVDEQSNSRLLHLSAAGDLVWERDLSVPVDGLAAFADGGVAMVGELDGQLVLNATGGGTLTLNSADRDGFLVRLDADGNAMWGRTVAGVLEDKLWDVAPDGFGGLIATGYVSNSAVLATADGTELATFEDQVVNALLDTIVFRLDANGDPLWTRRAAGEGNNEGRAITVGMDRQIHVAGRFAGNVTFEAEPAPLSAVNGATPTIFFYAGYAAKFDLATGGTLSLVSTSAEDSYLEEGDFVAGHVDGSTTHGSEFLGTGEFGVPGVEKVLPQGGAFFVRTNPQGACKAP